MPHPSSNNAAQVILQIKSENHGPRLLTSRIIDQADEDTNLINAMVPMLQELLKNYGVREIDYSTYEDNYEFCKDALEQLEEDDVDVFIFINYLKSDKFNTLYIIHIEDLKPEGLTEEEILSEFDDWVKIIRDRIVERYREGQLPTGRDIIFAPNGLDYQTEYVNRKPSEREKSCLHHEPHHNNFYFGEI